MFGLEESDLSCIIDLIKAYPEIDEAIIFGSRSLQKQRRESDIDIAIKGDSSELIIPKLAGQLNDETPLPYFFDLLDYDSIDNDDLKSHIDRVGKVIYKRS